MATSVGKVMPRFCRRRRDWAKFFHGEKWMKHDTLGETTLKTWVNVTMFPVEDTAFFFSKKNVRIIINGMAHNIGLFLIHVYLKGHVV